jgi:hypothetical protein
MLKTIGIHHCHDAGIVDLFAPHSKLPDPFQPIHPYLRPIIQQRELSLPLLNFCFGQGR